MEKLSLEKFDASKMSKDEMFQAKGGQSVSTKWTGSNGTSSGHDIHETDTGITAYDDGCFGVDGIITC